MALESTHKNEGWINNVADVSRAPEWLEQNRMTWTNLWLIMQRIVEHACTRQPENCQIQSQFQKNVQQNNRPTIVYRHKLGTRTYGDRDFPMTSPLTRAWYLCVCVCLCVRAWCQQQSVHVYTNELVQQHYVLEWWNPDSESETLCQVTMDKWPNCLFMWMPQ